MPKLEEKESLNDRIFKVKTNKLLEKSHLYFETLVEMWEDRLERVKKGDNISFVNFSQEEKQKYCEDMIEKVKAEWEKIK